ncbi:MAG: DNA cytosine methyltransferase [Eubacterium sp.]
MVNCLSLFSGAGIGEAYLKDIGINVVVANEIDSKRADFYKHLYQSCDMICGDITDENIYSNVIKKSKENNVEFIIATPPCQGMSTVGLQDPNDERNQLIKYAVDAVLDIKPKFALFENVPEQETTYIKFNNRRVLIPRYIERRLGKEYRINYGVVDSQYYRVPQSRKRLIFLLTRKDTKVKWDFPEREPIITLREAFKEIPDLWPNIKEPKYRNVLPKNTEEALKFHKWHKPPTHIWRNVECMMFAPTGQTAFNNDKHYPRNANGKKVKAYSSTYRRMSWDQPANTVTQCNGFIGSQSTVHPGKPAIRTKDGEIIFSNPRVLTIYELMVVSSLPYDWDIPNWASDHLIRSVIGEGVPPLMLKKIFSKVQY